MKTIVHKDNKESKYLFEDSKPVIIEAHQITVGSDPVDFYVGDMSSANAILYENVTNAPSDWTGCKYLFDGKVWTKNPKYVEPKKDS